MGEPYSDARWAFVIISGVIWFGLPLALFLHQWWVEKAIAKAEGRE